MARTEGKNPGIPDWLAADYFQAIRQLAETASVNLLQTEEKKTIGAMLGIVAIAKGLRVHGRFLVKYTEDELLDIESRARF